MAAIGDQTDSPVSQTASRRRRLFIVLACSLLLVSALGAEALGLFSRSASPYAAIDAYTAAAATGDRAALGAIIGESQQRQALIDRHAGTPMTPTSVSMEMTVSSAWWTAAIRYELPGQQAYTEHLLVHPRSDSPDRPIDYVVEPAP